MYWLSFPISFSISGLFFREVTVNLPLGVCYTNKTFSYSLNCERCQTMEIAFLYFCQVFHGTSLMKEYYLCFLNLLFKVSCTLFWNNKNWISFYFNSKGYKSLLFSTSFLFWCSPGENRQVNNFKFLSTYHPSSVWSHWRKWKE